MPGCVLRIAGKDWDVDFALQDILLKPCQIWRRGEHRPSVSEKLHETSGATFVASEADGYDVSAQVRDTVTFLQTYAADLRQILGSPGIGEASLDFGSYFQVGDLCQSHYFQFNLLQACVALGIEIRVSVYAVADDAANVGERSGEPAI